VSEVRLIDGQHLLHDLARHADLLADVPDALALELTPDDCELDAIGVVDRDRRLAVRERSDHEALAERAVELFAVVLDQVWSHGTSC
jgi:hypothetical protein